MEKNRLRHIHYVRLWKTIRARNEKITTETRTVQVTEHCRRLLVHINNSLISSFKFNVHFSSLFQHSTLPGKKMKILTKFWMLFLYKFLIVGLNSHNIFIKKGEMCFYGNVEVNFESVALQTHSAKCSLGNDSESAPKLRNPLKTCIELSLIYLDYSPKRS
jgi:hypothetical protein